MLLDKRQRNELFEIVADRGFDPLEFDLDHTETHLTLFHRPSGGRFHIELSRMGLTASPKVGDENPSATIVKGYHVVAGMVREWLEAVRYDQETPELWAQLDRAARTYGTGSLDPAENTPFTSSEQEEIAARLSELKASAEATYSLSGEQQRALEQRLDYLAQAATRVGRVDWRNLVVGALIGAMADALISPATIRSIFGALIGSLSHLFGVPIPQLPGP